jgi:transposase/DNA-directed RNA polymerase subunit K/omega
MMLALVDARGSGAGMLTVETIGRIRRAYFIDGKPIRQIVRELRVSRKAVRKAVRATATEFRYERRVQPQPRLGPFVARLEELLAANAKRPARERLTARRLFEQLRAEGYEGAYDGVQRHVRAWRRERARGGEVFIPLWFAPGEAYQFDWSHEVVVLGGVTTVAKVAHVRLCHSRMFLSQAYPRETQEMVFDAHERAFRLFGGAGRRGIYDNLSTAVDAVFLGKDRRFNRRFLQMCSHHLVEPVACTPAAGWEKGQVENQVGNLRERFFTPRLRFASYAELNAWLVDRCVAHARATAHPEMTDRSVFEAFEAERPSLIAYPGPFDGFRATEVAVSKSSLVRFDHNRYSVAVRAARRPAQLRAYADRIVVWHDGEIVGEHPRRFGRGQTVYDPWHYLPVLARKPGALRNGQPFRDWALPPGLTQVRRRLAGHADGDRQIVDILAAVADDGLDAVEAACLEALEAELCSRDVVLNLLARRRQPPTPPPVATPVRLALALEPAADCGRYDALRQRTAAGGR